MRAATMNIDADFSRESTWTFRAQIRDNSFDALKWCFWIGRAMNRAEQPAALVTMRA
jgi:hypothetical protein